MISIQQNITTALCIVADILNDQSKVNHKYTREDIFNKSNEISSLLIHTHKEVSLARKHNVKDLLQSFLHGLCIKKHSSNSSLISNKFLLEEDLGDGVNKNVQKGRSYRKFQKLQSGGQRPPKSMQRYPQYQGQRYKNLRQEPDPDRTPRAKEGISWRSGSAFDLGSKGPRFESPGLHGVSPLQPLNVKFYLVGVTSPVFRLCL